MSGQARSGGSKSGRVTRRVLGSVSGLGWALACGAMSRRRRRRYPDAWLGAPGWDCRRRRCRPRE
eukprot:1706915-Prymnesium_polylepis.1